MMDIKKYLITNKEIVDQKLSNLVVDSSIPDRLRDAMNYSLLAGGKRLRPILVIAGAEAVGGKAHDVLNLACALEMVHTFSLIHDDLPAMDDDDLRRGKPTNHKVFGEDVAILAGDALLIEAFYLIASSINGMKPESVIDVMKDIAKASGARGMTGGQVLDMEGEGALLTEGQLERVHKYKTGALINVSVTSGAKLCGADAGQLKALDNYGSSVGLAFQIMDDLLDIVGDERILGKDIGSDLENKKSTYPSLLGLDGSKKMALEIINKALENLSCFDRRADPLREIANYIVRRES